MKPSTKRSSSKPIPGVRGLIFFTREVKPLIITVEAWVAKGKPANCFVYDGAHQLLSAGIPISDAVEVEGRWVRTPINTRVRDTVYKKYPIHPKKRVRTSSIPLKESEFMTLENSVGRKKLR